MKKEPNNSENFFFLNLLDSFPFFWIMTKINYFVLKRNFTVDQNFQKLLKLYHQVLVNSKNIVKLEKWRSVGSNILVKIIQLVTKIK